MNWTDDRCAELDDFRDLLHEVSSINSGSHCLERIARCIAIAERLQRGDLDTGRRGFWQFVQEQAIRDRQPALGELELTPGSTADAVRSARGSTIAPKGLRKVGVERPTMADVSIWMAAQKSANERAELDAAPPALAVPEEPTSKQVASACFAYRHDFGLLDEDERAKTASECRAWWLSIAKELNSPSRHPMVLAAAKDVMS